MTRPRLRRSGGGWPPLCVQLLEVAATAGAFVGLRRLGMVGSLPLAGLLALLAVTGTAQAWAHRRWGPGCSRRQLYARVAVEMAGTSAVIYATGWGPALAVGFVVIVATDLKLSGSAAWRPAALFSVLGIIAGQVTFATGLIQSYIASPEVNGVAVLSALGLIFVIGVLGQKTAALEEQEARRSRAEETLSRSERHFRSLVQNSLDVVTVTDRQGRIVYVSPSVERVMGYRPEAYMASDGAERVHPEDVARASAAFSPLLGLPGQDRTLELRILHADGTWRWQEVTVRNEFDDPAVAGLVTTHRDISERRAYQDRLAYEAHHDPLTGLLNRPAFLERLDQALVRARGLSQGVAVLFVDLDRFKMINDSLGHHLGDRVLAVAAERLAHCLRPGDTLARFAGDEFTVLLEDVVDQAGAAVMAERLAEVLHQPIDVGSRTVVVTASVGVTVSASGLESAEDLLGQADLAMYAAKQGGRARASIFDERTTPQFTDRVELEAALRSALERDELVVYYQPVVTLPGGGVKGFEALLRWELPGRGLLGPIAFVGVAEETGLIVPIGRFVLETACRTLAEWHRRWPGHHLTMNVNVSPVQVHPHFADEVAEVLAATGLPPAALTLEITESVLLAGEATAGVLHQLHDLGVQLALDDFGTGYSSLSYLRRLPVDIVKIDRAFVVDLDSDSADTAIVQAITDIAHRLGLVTVAEGVETPEQALILTSLGCDHAQGFLFGHPEPSNIADALLDMHYRVRT